MRLMLPLVALMSLSACATSGPNTVMAGGQGAATASGAGAPLSVKIIALNDFHGALEPPQASVAATTRDGAEVRVPAGGAAHLATAVARLRAQNANSIVVAAGDLTGASPFASSQFLDEPAILALDMIGLDLNAVGNHEFDRGTAELRRLQEGGCDKHTVREPCRVDGSFPGARFRYLAANVRGQDGRTIFPATAIRSFGEGERTVRVGFIGLTLKETPTLVVPSAVADLTFEDEATTINQLVPELKREGADAIVVLVHQGVSTTVGYNDKSCAGVSGDLLPILAKLDPAVDVVVSGHTHSAYICDHGAIDPARPFLLTSAGSRGMMVTDITLTFDPATRRVGTRSADNIIVQGAAYRGPDGDVPVRSEFPAFAADRTVGALVSRYVAAAEPIARRTVGRVAAPLLRERTPAGETPLGLVIADAQARAMNADIAFMNTGGLRADLVPGEGGTVTYGQIFSVQPFGNVLQVKGLTGRQLRAVLEQQFARGGNGAERRNILQPSSRFAFSYDLTRPEGRRVVAMTLDGRAIEDDRTYRVAVSNFLANGGDSFTAFRVGTDLASGMEDVDALEAHIAAGALAVPTPGRVTRIDTPPAR